MNLTKIAASMSRATLIAIGVMTLSGFALAMFGLWIFGIIGTAQKPVVSEQFHSGVTATLPLYQDPIQAPRLHIYGVVPPGVKAVYVMGEKVAILTNDRITPHQRYIQYELPYENIPAYLPIRFRITSEEEIVDQIDYIPVPYQEYFMRYTMRDSGVTYLSHHLANFPLCFSKGMCLVEVGARKHLTPQQLKEIFTPLQNTNTDINPSGTISPNGWTIYMLGTPLIDVVGYWIGVFFTEVLVKWGLLIAIVLSIRFLYTQFCAMRQSRAETRQLEFETEQQKIALTMSQHAAAQRLGRGSTIKVEKPPQPALAAPSKELLAIQLHPLFLKGTGNGSEAKAAGLQYARALGLSQKELTQKYAEYFQSKKLNQEVPQS